MTDNRTPAGGNRSEITFYDANGNVTTTAADAAGAEIREYADDILIRRTYMDKTTGTRPRWTPPGDVRAEPDFIDFAKNTWDIYVNDDGQYRLAETLPDLLDALGWDTMLPETQRANILNLMSLPAWQAAPQELKDAAAQWLAAN